jgi:hypothetical protein
LEQQEKLIWWKWTKRIIASLGILVVLFVGVSLLVINLYEEEIKRFAVEKINDNLTTEVDVKAIDLTLIDQFPMASLRFKDVFIADKLSPSKKDTMISIGYLYLNLNFMDLIGGKYDIKDIKATNTIAYLKIDNEGHDNYSIWKKDTSATTQQFSFDLEKVRFKNLDLDYQNKIQRQKLSITTEQLKLAGEFSDVSYQLKTNGELFVNEFTNDSINYLTNKNAILNLDLLINTKEQSYTINKGELDLEDLNFSIDGKYTADKKENAFIDLNIKGNNISFISAFSVFPEAFLTPLKKYDSKGLLNFNASLKGEVGKSIIPKIEAEFSLEQGALTERTNNISLNNLSFSGHFSNQNKDINSLLILKNIKGELSNNGGQFSGELTLKDFSNLQIESIINANLNLAVLNNFLAIPSIKTLNGNATVNYQIRGKYLANQFKIAHSSGTVNFSAVNVATTSNNLAYENLSGLGKLNQNDLVFNNLNGTIGGSNLSGNASLRNFIPYLINPLQKVWIDATINSKQFDLLKLIQLIKTEEKQNTTVSNDSVSLPKQFQVNLKTTINELNYGNFKAKNITGLVRLKNQHLYTQNIKFKTSGGNVLFNSEIEQTPNHHFLWTGNSRLDGIDIQQFFTSVDNFGQDFLTDKNIKGKGSLILDFGMLFSPNLTLIEPSITVNARTKITNGMLLNHSTMNELAVYLDENKLVNKVVDTKKLKKKINRIKFSELNNSIQIKNNNIVIPKTTIKTNILDINIAGEHSFDDKIDYHFSFGLRDVLIKNKHAEDFGPIKDDGLGKVLFLRVFGDLNDPQYEIDKSEKKAIRKEMRAEEKQNVKSILKNEFGLFKSDTTLQKQTEKVVEPTFEIENWEEEDQKNQEEPLKEEEKPKKEKKTPKWLKKLGIEENKEPQQNISVEFEED